jgi:TRAP-type transport system periplasmic protein
MKKTAVMTTLIMLIAGLAMFVQTATAETIELRFASPFSPRQTMIAKVFPRWAENVTKATNGKLKVSMFPGGALGKTPAHYSIAEKGVADIAYSLHDYTPGRFPMTSVFELPFMVPSAEKTSMALWKVFDQFPEFQKEYSKVKVLALFVHPGGHFNTTKKPIRSLADFKGMKFRTANPHVTKALKSFGAIPVNMPITETYMSIERGVVEGTVLPWEGNFVFKLAELLKYGTEVDFYTMTMFVVMNKKKWNSLPADVKKAIDANSGMVFSQDAGKTYDGARPFMKKMCLKKGMESITLPASEMAKLKALTAPLREDWVKEMEAKGFKSAKDVLAAAVKYVNE